MFILEVLVDAGYGGMGQFYIMAGASSHNMAPDKLMTTN